MGHDVIKTKRYSSPCGGLILGSYQNKLCLCDWVIEKHRNRADNRLRNFLKAELTTGTSKVIETAILQLDEFFTGMRMTFSVPLLFVGTDFQKEVWNALLRIPYGKTLSYGELARLMGRPTSVRAVANANGANMISIFAPCHRVIGSDGTLTGYGGGLDAKRYLIKLESK